VTFWRALLPGRWVDSSAPEFAGKWRDDAGSPLQLLFQELGEPEGLVRAHLDLGTDDLDAPPILWEGTDTAIQATGINHDFGAFDDPDAFYDRPGSNLPGPKALLYRHAVRHAWRRTCSRVRSPR